MLLEGAKTIAGEKGTSSERSFIMIKPDGVSRQLVGKVSLGLIRRVQGQGLMADRLAFRGYVLPCHATPSRWQ